MYIQNIIQHTRYAVINSMKEVLCGKGHGCRWVYYGDIKRHTHINLFQTEKMAKTMAEKKIRYMQDSSRRNCDIIIIPVVETLDFMDWATWLKSE